MKSFFNVSISLLTLLLFCACKPKPERSYDPESGVLFPIRVQLDWFPEPQHGGLYTAQAKGYFAEEGLEVELRSGGSNVLVVEFVGTGKADIGQSASTQVMRGIAKGVPVINFASNFHRLPSSLMMHESNPIDSFEELHGKTIIGRTEAVYIPYLKNHYNIDFEIIPQTYGLGTFASNPDTIQEGYFIAETFYLREKDIAVKWLPLYESGYEPYATLFVNTDFASQHPEAMKAFTRAYLRGWKEYLEGDPEPANGLIQAANPRASDAFMQYSRQMIIDYKLAEGLPEKGESYGSMKPERYAKEIKQLERIGILEEGQLTVEDAVTLKYLPQ